MDDEDHHPFTWLTKHIPRKVLLVYATLGLGIAAFALWENFQGGGLSPIVIVFFAPVVAIGMGSELVDLVRALRAPTRRPFKLRRGWLSLFMATGSLLLFGVWGIVDDDPGTSVVIGLMMLVAGVALMVAFLRYMAKPVRNGDNA